MEKVARRYKQGSGAFVQDSKEAFRWYRKAHEAGSLLGTAKMGDMLVAGAGVEQDVATGMMFLGMAGGEGSDLAAYILGLILADGLDGVQVSRTRARQWLERSLSGDCKHQAMSKNAKRAAREKLDELLALQL